VWNEQGAFVKIIITPPFWKTAWFRLFVMLAVAGLIYLIYRYRINRLLELERMRIQIASDLHDDIGSTLTKIAVYSETIQTTGEKTKVKESSRKIGEMSREIITTLSDIVWSIDARNDSVGDLIDRMRDFLDTAFPPGSIQIDFQTKGLSFQQKINQTLRQNIYLIFKEAVNNAAKHSQASQIRIHLTNGEGKFRMEIGDNGIGIDVAQERSGHHGLANMKLRAARIGGDLRIETLPGTRVILTAKAI
jgi:signal transduction histidine kinase